MGRRINSENSDESDEKSYSTWGLGFEVLCFERPDLSSFLFVLDLAFFFLLVVSDKLEFDAVGSWQVSFFEADESDETDGVLSSIRLGLKMLFAPLVFPGLLLVRSPLHLKQVRLFWSFEETTPQLGCIALWQSAHLEFLGIKSFGKLHLSSQAQSQRDMGMVIAVVN